MPQRLEQKKSIFAVLPFLALIVITIVSFFSERNEISSVFLKAETTEDDAAIVICYFISTKRKLSGIMTNETSLLLYYFNGQKEL